MSDILLTPYTCAEFSILKVGVSEETLTKCGTISCNHLHKRRHHPRPIDKQNVERILKNEARGSHLSRTHTQDRCRQLDRQ